MTIANRLIQLGTVSRSLVSAGKRVSKQLTMRLTQLTTCGTNTSQPNSPTVQDMQLSVAIIVPILNEAANLARLINQLGQLDPMPQHIILVDGGSDDDSVIIGQTLIAQLGDAINWQLIQSPRGRAQQMNAGAQHAGTDLLLFLHADTCLPNEAMRLIHSACVDIRWGRFDVRLDSRTPMLILVSWMINLRSRLTGIATGDQAIFIKRSTFESMGGYPDQPLMEDIELCKRLKSQRLRPACLKAHVITSARRWQTHGMWRTIVLMWQLRFDYWCGVSPTVLKRRYH